MTTSRSAPRVVLAHLSYLLLLHLACVLAIAPWLARALCDRRQWRWMAGRLGRLPPAGLRGVGPRPVWLHAVSVGEVKASRRLVAALHARGMPVVLSTGTLTGMQTARGLFPGLTILAWPLDLPWVVRHVLKSVNPRAIVMVELEAWPTLMRLADARGIPLAIVNGRVSAASFASYRRLRFWLPEFDRISLVAAQTEEYARRVVALGVPAERVHVCGNLKHDLAQPPDARRVAALTADLGLAPGRAVFLAGSTHDGEDEPVLRAWREAGGFELAALLIVPRHLRRVPEIRRLLASHELPSVLRSELPDGQCTERVIVVDSMGELEALFGLADVVFLGGSLVPVGGHNVLEPAAAGRPVLVGPYLDACRVECDALERTGGLLRVQDEQQLALDLRRLFEQPDERKRMGRAARRAQLALVGSTRGMLELLLGSGLLAGPTLETGAKTANLEGSPQPENTAPGVHHP